MSLLTATSTFGLRS